MANSSHGPSKWLYAVAGWCLGGIVGQIGAMTLIAIMGPQVAVAAYLGGLVCAIAGARMGWNKAARAQASYSAPTVVRTTVSHNMADEVSPDLAPALTKEQALAQVEQMHTQFESKQEKALEAEQQEAAPLPEEKEVPAYIQNFRPTVSKVEAVQAERSESPEIGRY